ncbi:helix-turn-helix domain-containing protein [Rhodosalinus sediminis]|uniref:helix-turn-helix domain-containing protein n=1 Tax=Rhodosalinus sediminis TaxID=1940533 RepID=UPI0023556289|nr:helix-turn-helix domain-containing protein [Rhodosalinus sediminis]
MNEDLQEAVNWYGPEVATFGDRLAAARERAAMTQAQLARRLGVKLSTLRGWEDDLSEPRANRLSMMAGILNVSIMWLLTGEGDGLDGPEDTAEVPAEVGRILASMRELRTELKSASDRLARLEKQLRVQLRESGQ